MATRMGPQARPTAPGEALKATPQLIAAAEVRESWEVLGLGELEDHPAMVLAKPSTLEPKGFAVTLRVRNERTVTRPSGRYVLPDDEERIQAQPARVLFPEEPLYGELAGKRVDGEVFHVRNRPTHALWFDFQYDGAWRSVFIQKEWIDR